MPPISPIEAKKRQQSSIPEVVFEIFNELLASGERYISQSTVVQLLKERMKPEEYDQVFKRGWLDIEPHYRKKGWKVEYDKPGYCETYEASWSFSSKRSRT